ncbi:MAG TPA: DUF5615 family PIN-like protein [Thermoplasmata archaeon]|nr:DUF5615 family PIN-like protein [Thermoplasmata archaeon]
MAPSGLRLLLDDNLGGRTFEFLVSLGHDVVRAKDLLGRGAENGEIASAAARAGRILVTLDLDFGPIHLRGGAAAGIILVRHKRPTPQIVNRILGGFLRSEHSTSDRMRGCLVVVTEKKWRIRRL